MIRDAHDFGPSRSLADRLPPQNLEAEAAVLGSVLTDANALYEVLPVLSAEDFYRDSHQLAYRAIRDMADAGKPVDLQTLYDELDARGEAERVGGYGFMAELVDSVPNSVNALHYAGIVLGLATRRRVIETSGATLRLAYSKELTAEKLVAAAQAEFLALGDRDAGSEVTLHQAAKRALGTMDRRWRGEDPGVRLPWGGLDAILDGFRPGRLYVVAGRPGAGKSALLFNAADHAAMPGYGPGVPALFFSLEMDAEELAERYLSARAGVNGYAFKRPGDLDADRLRSVYDAGDAAADSRLRIDDDGALTVPQIAARARRCKHRHGLGIVFVDYLQLVDGQKGKGENRQEEVARVSRGLKRLAKELKVPVVAACQLNRAGLSRPAGEQEPRISDLRESGQLEQDAHGVLLMHDPEDGSGSVVVNVAKNRGGSTGKFLLRFVREETRFDVIPPAVPAPDPAEEEAPYC